MANWESVEQEFDGRLVRLATGDKTQTVNICTKENILGKYEVSYVIDDPEEFLTEKSFGSSPSLDELIRRVESRGGTKRSDRGEPRSGS